MRRARDEDGQGVRPMGETITYGPDPDPDDVSFLEVESVHIERMDDDHIWMGVYLPGNTPNWQMKRWQNTQCSQSGR